MPVVVRRPVVVRPVGAPIARAMVTTAAVVGTAALVSGSMNRNQGQACYGHQPTTVVVQGAPAAHAQPTAAALPPVNSSVYIYVLSASGFYLSQEGEKHVSGKQPLDPQLSVFHEQHVGNGYFVLASHYGRLLSTDRKNPHKIRLSKVHTPVKQKCMWYREIHNQQVRYRNVNGNYLTIAYGGIVSGESAPQHGSFFTLQTVPVAPAPSVQAPPANMPPPPQNVRDLGPIDVTNQKDDPSSNWYAMPSNTQPGGLYSYGSPAPAAQPAYGQSAYAQPQQAYGQPAYGQPAYAQPTYNDQPPQSLYSSYGQAAPAAQPTYNEQPSYAPYPAAQPTYTDQPPMYTTQNYQPY